MGILGLIQSMHKRKKGSSLNRGEGKTWCVVNLLTSRYIVFYLMPSGNRWASIWGKEWEQLKKLGERVKAIREQKGLTLEKVAANIGKDQ
jgi:hypothetical protein